MADFSSTLPTGQAPVGGDAGELAQVVHAPVAEPLTRVTPMPAANDQAAAAEALWKIPPRTDGDFVSQGIRGTPAGEAHHEAVKAISDDIARQKAAAPAAALGEAGEVGEVGEEMSALGQVGKVLASPAVAGPLAALNVAGGAVDVAGGVAEVMNGQVGYGVADTAVGATNMVAGGTTLAELATTGAVAASPLGVVAGAAGLGVKGDKFLKENGLLDGMFGKDENGASYGLMGGIGHTLNRAIHGDGVAIAESVAGVSMLPLLIPALIGTEVDSGLTSLAASGIDLLGGDSKGVGHAISDAAGGVWEGAKGLWEHFSD